ncbi:uncharacterized protein LY89DRAFT_715284 [Mollisia scopiformis]|uniref:Uncharacterized protein n=1 Tax=Mollisia scopiformis TaxID=149040 RepID=A0A194XLH7_MOLSC|nr:uncharacterized protein LY89DRAFT_715284 [Mollisia scopiformis]KUJ20986.1 hypothetical protein LY89DRAFT_715284 [Mollisia scopiformis]
MPDAAKEGAETPDVGVAQTGGKEAYTFRFVEVGEPSQDRDEDARAIIRSHVMRDFYEKRDRRKRPNKPPLLSAAPAKDTGLPRTHRFKVGPQGLQELKKRRKKSDNVPGTSSSVVTNNLAAKVIAARSPASQKSASGSGQSSPQTFEPSVRNDQQSVIAPSQPTFSSQSRQIALQPERHPFGSGVLDPFNTLPPSASSQTQHLLYYADRGILSSRLMGQLRTEWLSLATQDTALFHVALSHYAGNYGLAHQQNDPVEALRFRMEAMRIVNERLADINSAMTDGTLGTVASLSSYEATNGTLSAIETHLRGLQRLVNLRGGLTQGSMNKYTRRLVLWADLNCANALGTNPVFPILESDRCARAISWFDTATEAKDQWPSAVIFGDSVLAEGDLQRMTRELKDDFTALKYFSDLGHIDRTNNEEGKMQQIYDSDKLYFTERSLLTLSNSWGPSKFATSGCLAAIIFLDNYFRGVAFHARIMASLHLREHISRLPSFLGVLDISRHNANEGSTKALFWVLCVGGVASGVRPERDWFISHLLSFTDALELQMWEQAELVLKTFLWPNAWSTDGRALWAQLEEARITNSMIWPFNMDITPLGHYQWSLLDANQHSGQ